MLGRNATVHRQFDAKQGFGGDAKRTSVLAEPSHASLGLPRLSRSIPAQIEGDEHDWLWAEMAAVLLKAGMIEDEESDRSLESVVTDGITRWLAQTWEGLKFFDFEFGIMEAPDISGYYKTDAAAYQGAGLHGLDDGFMHTARVELMVKSNNMQLTINAKPLIEYLEGVRAGLGGAALDALNMAPVGLGLRGFEWFNWMGQYLYFGYEEDEKAYCESMDIDIDDYTGVTKAELSAAFPSRESLGLKTLTKKELREIAASDSIPADAAKVASCLLRIKKDIGKVFHLHQLTGPYEWEEDGDEFAVALTWGKDDTAERLLDDMTQNLYEGGCEFNPGISVLRVPTDMPAWFSEQSARWKKQMPTIRALDELLGMASGMSPSQAEEVDG